MSFVKELENKSIMFCSSNVLFWTNLVGRSQNSGVGHVLCFQKIPGLHLVSPVLGIWGYIGGGGETLCLSPWKLDIPGLDEPISNSVPDTCICLKAFRISSFKRKLKILTYGQSQTARRRFGIYLQSP